MRLLEGDLIEQTHEGFYDVVFHGCHCWCYMGAGFAKKLVKRFPGAAVVDANTAKGDTWKLGRYSRVIAPTANGSVLLINAYTQYYYGTEHVKVPFDKLAFERAMLNILHNYGGKGLRFACPMIGGGLGRGDWGWIAERLSHLFVDESLTVVYLPQDRKKVNRSAGL